jgi:hypothetical protein
MQICIYMYVSNLYLCKYIKHFSIAVLGYTTMGWI